MGELKYNLEKKKEWKIWEEIAWIKEMMKRF